MSLVASEYFWSVEKDLEQFIQTLLVNGNISTIFICSGNVEIFWFKRLLSKRNISLCNFRFLTTYFAENQFSDIFSSSNQVILWNNHNSDFEHLLKQIPDLKIKRFNLKNPSNLIQDGHKKFIFCEDILSQIGYTVQNLNGHELIGIVANSNEICSILETFFTRNNIAFHPWRNTRQNSPESIIFRHWKNFQIGHSIQNFILFLHALQITNHLSSQEVKTIKSEVHKIYTQIPLDDIDILSRDSSAFYLRQLISKCPILPETATVREFAKKIENIFPLHAKKINNQETVLSTQEFLYFLESEISFSPKQTCTLSNIFIINSEIASNLAFDKLFILSDKNSPLPSAFYADTTYFVTNVKSIPTSIFHEYKNSQNQSLKILEVPIISLEGQFPFIQSFDNSTSCEFHFPKSSDISYQTQLTPIDLSATALERAYEFPEEIWFKNFLKIYTPPYEFSKQKLSGILTHRLLEMHSPVFLDLETFSKTATEQVNCFLFKLLSLVNEIPSLIREAVDPLDSEVIYNKLLLFKETFPFVSSEVNLASTIVLSSREIIPVHGRADCVLSKKPLFFSTHPSNHDNSILIIDFKTGNTSQKNLEKLSKSPDTLPQNLSGLQILLYGLIFRSWGYRDIQLLILNKNPYEIPTPIHINELLNEGNLPPFLENFLTQIILNGFFLKNIPNFFSKNQFEPPLSLQSFDKEKLIHLRKKILNMEKS